MYVCKKNAQKINSYRPSQDVAEVVTYSQGTLQVFTRRQGTLKVVTYR